MGGVEAFANIGLGIGVCTDMISEKRRDSSPRRNGRIIGNAINLAAAMTKTRDSPKDIRVFIDENTKVLLKLGKYQLKNLQNVWPLKVAKFDTFYEVMYSELEAGVSLDTQTGLMTPPSAEGSFQNSRPWRSRAETR